MVALSGLLVVVWNLSVVLVGGRVTPVAFSEFIRWVETAHVDQVELIGDEVVGHFVKRRDLPHLRPGAV